MKLFIDASATLFKLWIFTDLLAFDSAYDGCDKYNVSLGKGNARFLACLRYAGTSTS